MLIGYARTSTLEQLAGLEAQQRDLKEYGCEEVYTEQVSSVAEREQLEAALNTLREGDKLVSTKLDRLARSVQHLGQIIERVNNAGAALVAIMVAELAAKDEAAQNSVPVNANLVGAL